MANVDDVARTELGLLGGRQGFCIAGKGVEVGIGHGDQADRRTGGRVVHRTNVEIGKLLRREKRESPPANRDDRDILFQVVVRRDMGGIADPQFCRGVPHQFHRLLRLETGQEFQTWFLDEIRAGMPPQRAEQADIPIRVMPNGDTAGARGAAIEALKLL